MKKRGEQSRHVWFGVYERLDFRFVGDDRVIIADPEDNEHILERVEDIEGRTMQGWVFDGKKVELELFDREGFRRLGAIANVGMRLNEVDRNQGRTRALCEIAKMTVRLSAANK